MREKGFSSIFIILVLGILGVFLIVVIFFFQVSKPKPNPTITLPELRGIVGPSKLAILNVKAATEDLAKRIGVPQSSISVISQEEVEWPDTSLGCPKEGMVYAQVITTGYKIILSYQGKNYSYHGALNQKPFLCDNAQKNETANWETYTNKELRFEFKRPPNWSEPQVEYGAPSFPFTFGYTSGDNPIDVKDVNKTYWITVGFISQSQLSVMGITYCGAYPNDSPRCQKTQIGNVNSVIDWGTTENKTAYVSIPHPNGGIVTFQLNPVNTENKKTFNQILSTFRFID